MSVLLLLLVFFSCSQAVLHKQQIYTYIWIAAAPGSTGVGDHIATIDYTPDSDDYGRVIARTEIPPSPDRLTRGNEAHHLSITPDFTRIVAGGMMSSMQGKHDIFVFSINDDRIPVFETSLNFSGYGCVDSMLPGIEGHFLVTMMCNDQGGTPGGIILFDPFLYNYSVWNQANAANDVGLNPHAGEYNEDYGLIVANYVAAETLNATIPTYRNTLTHYNPDGSFNTTITFPGISSSPLGFNFVPGGTFGLTQSGQGDNSLYLVEPGVSTATLILNISELYGLGTRQSVPSSFFATDITGTNGTRFIFSFQMRYIAIVGFDPISKNASLLYLWDFCAPPSGYGVPDQQCATNNNAPGTHFLRLHPGTGRLLVTNYYLDRYAASKSVHSFYLSANKDSLRYDMNFSVNLGGANYAPHGLAFAGWRVAVAAPLTPGIFMLIYLAYPLLVIFLFICWTVYRNLLDGEDPWEKEGSGVVVPPLFGWHPLINSHEWRIVCFLQSLFICGGIIQASLQRAGKTPSSPLWSVALHIAFMIPCWMFGPSWSPIGFVARSIAVHFPSNPVPAQPKRFAAFLHLFMSIIAFSMWFGLYWVENPGAFPWILVVFLGLLWIDCFIGFCPGCFMYAYIMAPNGLYLPGSLKEYHRIKGEPEYYGIYYRWIPRCYYDKLSLGGGGKPAAVTGASKWRTHCENGICKLIRCDDP